MARVWIVIVAALAAVVGAIAFVRHRHAAGIMAPGGVLIGDISAYDRTSRILLGGLFRGIAANVADAAPPAGRVLEVGCGPGQLAIELASSHDLDVTGLDLDPAMVERARANAVRSKVSATTAPTFVVGDVAALPFSDASFDLVISTFSMHHWSDRPAGLREIARVLRPGGRALIWDLKPGILPFHPEVHEAAVEVDGSTLGTPAVTPWRWPYGLTLAQRFDFGPAQASRAP